MRKTFIIGHKNPDTDTVVSALIAEDYFKNILKMNVKACRSGEINNETKFVLKHFGFSSPEQLQSPRADDSVILVDHNEEGQLSDGLGHSHVVGIVDHHKTVLKTEKPLFIRIEPLGSTASILAKMYKEAGRKISKRLAGLMLAGILSDTLNLSGPTTTEQDKKLVKEINKIAKLDIRKFVKALFAAKSSLEGISVETIVNQDYKLFEMGKHRVGISTWETTDPISVAPMKEKIRQVLKRKKEKDKIDLIFFFVADIIKQDSILYVSGETEEELASKVFKADVKNGEAFLPGIISRKKQIVPPLTLELSK